MSNNLKYLFSCSKDGSIIKCNIMHIIFIFNIIIIFFIKGSLESGMKMHTIKKRLPNKKNDDQNGHTDEILCLALSTDFKFLVI